MTRDEERWAKGEAALAPLGFTMDRTRVHEATRFGPLCGRDAINASNAAFGKIRGYDVELYEYVVVRSGGHTTWRTQETFAVVHAPSLVGAAQFKTNPTFGQTWLYRVGVAFFYTPSSP